MRRFAGWALGYAGPSLFVQRSIATPVTESVRGSQRGISDLLRLMVGFRAEEGADSDWRRGGPALPIAAERMADPKTVIH